jgi:hypothetical protein
MREIEGDLALKRRVVIFINKNPELTGMHQF